MQSRGVMDGTEVVGGNPDTENISSPGSNPNNSQDNLPEVEAAERKECPQNAPSGKKKKKKTKWQKFDLGDNNASKTHQQPEGKHGQSSKYQNPGSTPHGNCWTNPPQERSFSQRGLYENENPVLQGQKSSPLQANSGNNETSSLPQQRGPCSTDCQSPDFIPNPSQCHQGRQEESSVSQRDQSGTQRSSPLWQSNRGGNEESPFSERGQYSSTYTPTGSEENHHPRKQDRLSSGRRNTDLDVKLSKQLAFMLRHGAKKEGFTLMEGGFLYVEDLLEHRNLSTFTTADVERVVSNNDKKRFHLEKDDDGHLKIRANQGHTLEVEGLDLMEITSAEGYPVVIHGTNRRNLEYIQKSGLSRMKRQHIHCAVGVPGEDGVISGMRNSCDVIIDVDLEKALKDGLKFFKSANNVILTEGNQDGILLPKYFKKVVNRRTGARM